MRVEVLVPQIGEAVAELALVAWHKREGDAIEKGDLLFEIDSDKAIVEVEAFVGGTLTQIIAPDQSAVMPQQVVAIIETAEYTRQAIHTGAGSDVQKPPHALEHDNSTEVARRGPETLIQGKKSGDSPKAVARPKISPKARRLAKQAGIDWTVITGSGADGMIVVGDVERAIEALDARES